MGSWFHIGKHIFYTKFDSLIILHHASSKSSAGSSSNCSNGGYSSGAALCSLVCKFIMTETFTSGESSLSSMLSNFQFNSLLSSFDILEIILLICLVLWKKCKKQQSTKWDRLSVGHDWVLWRLVASAAEISTIWLAVSFYFIVCLRKEGDFF